MYIQILMHLGLLFEMVYYETPQKSSFCEFHSDVTDAGKFLENSDLKS